MRVVHKTGTNVLFFSFREKIFRPVQLTRKNKNKTVFFDSLLFISQKLMQLTTKKQKIVRLGLYTVFIKMDYVS